MWVFSSCSEQRMLECGVRASRCSGFSCSLHLGPKMHGLQSLQSVCSVALRHVRSFWTRGHTCVPCIGRWILNYRTTREILFLFFFFFFLRKKRGTISWLEMYKAYTLLSYWDMEETQGLSFPFSLPSPLPVRNSPRK